MKIKFPRRVKLTREIAIGLAVLLVLMVTLTVVAARRFVRRDAIIAMADERLAQRQEERLDKDSEGRRDAFPPALPDPALDPVREREKDKLREAQANERREEKHEAKIEHVAVQGFAATDAPKPAAFAKAQRREESKLSRKVDELPAPPSLDSDDRYGAAVAGPRVAGPRDRPEAGKAKPLVIQVSGDSPVGVPRQMDGQISEMRRDERRPEPARNHNAFAGGAPAMPMSDMDREHHGPHSIEPHNDAALTPPAYPTRDLRSGHDPAFSAVPMDGGRPGYPGPANYVRDETLRRDDRAHCDEFPHPNDLIRRDDFHRPFGETPLRNDGLYEVQPNDSFWTISQRVYGTGAYFRALVEVNRGKAARSDRLQPGLLISTPPVAQLEKDYPDLCPRPGRRETVRNRAAAAASLASYSGDRIYVVQEGDTLSSIARNELGKVSRWAEIYQLNRELLGKDYDYLTPGMKLAMPPRDGQPSDRMTRRGDDLPANTRY